VYDERAFTEEAIRRWGNLIPMLRDERVHFQMGCLANEVKRSFSSGNPKLGREILAFVEDALVRASVSEIENAVAISFLEPSDIEALGIAEYLPENVRRVLDEQQRRWQRAT
jgi:hypothetical protein